MYTGVGPQSFAYQDDAAPLLPKGTILHVTAFVNAGAKEAREVPMPTRRTSRLSIAIFRIFLSGGLTIPLTDEEFEREMAKRRAQQTSGLQPGCPAVNASPSARSLSPTDRPCAGRLRAIAGKQRRRAISSSRLVAGFGQPW